MSVDILSWLEEENPVEVSYKSTDTLTSTGQGTCFEINREIFLHLMEKAIIAIPQKDITPLYVNFQVSVKSDYLEIVATNDEITIVVGTNQVDVKYTGVELFPARTLYSIAKESAANSTIYCEATTHGLVIVAGNFSSELQMFRSKDYPQPISTEGIDFHEIDRQSFIDAISKVRYALPGRDFGGLASLGVVSIKNGKFTASDNNRFQQVRVDNFRLNMQLRAAGLNTLLKTLTASDQDVIEVAELDNHLVFRLNNLTYYTKKSGNTYPNVEQLWLKPALNNNQVFLVDKDELITAIKQVKTAADTESNAISLTMENNKLDVRIKSGQKSASTTISCVYPGKERKIVVNFIHLAEMLKAYEAKECKFLLGADAKGRKAPILLKDDETMAVAVINQLVAYRADL